MKTAVAQAHVVVLYWLNSACYTTALFFNKAVNMHLQPDVLWR